MKQSVLLLLLLSTFAGFAFAVDSLQRDSMQKSVEIKEISVVAKKPVITRNSEKTVFNVAQSPSHQTGSAEDALQNMPGVILDQKGNVSIAGKQGVKIYVDGKPSALAETNLQAFLKSIPANAIEAIELITNPSSKYEAEGNAGIINIKMKKGRADGFNASINATYGYTQRFNGNVVLNYRKKRWNWFGTYAPNYSQNGHTFVEFRKITIGDSTTNYKLYNPSKETQWAHNIKGGFDFFINEKNTLTYTLNANVSRGYWPGFSNAGNESGSGAIIGRYRSESLSIDNNLSITNDLLYTHTFDSTERKITLDVSHTYVRAKSFSNLYSYGLNAALQPDAAQSLFRKSYPLNNIHNVVVQFDYVEPLKLEGFKIETGLRNETTFNKNQFEVSDSTSAGVARNSLLSSGFSYTENIAAFYALLSGPVTKWFDFSVGLRTEHTLIKSTSSSVERNYLSFFPSASLNFNLNEKNNFSVSYARRVQRPAFQQLNNTITYFDQYSTWEGNPYLRPSFRDNVSASYNLMLGKHMISISAEGYFVKDIFNESTRIDSNRVARGGVINGSDNKGFNASVYAKIQVTKWWELQMNHLYMYQYYSYKQGVNSGPIAASTYQFWGDMSFKFWKNMVIDINGNYNSGEAFFQGKTRPWWLLNASVKKSFLKDHLTIAIVGNNLLESMRWQWYVNTGGLHTEGTWSNINRSVYLSVTYTFGNKSALNRRELENNERLSGGGKGK
ncbi:MAG: outer membrane beta-barrel family protein [Chitinophagales bacterium]